MARQLRIEYPSGECQCKLPILLPWRRLASGTSLRKRQNAARIVFPSSAVCLAGVAAQTMALAPSDLGSSPFPSAMNAGRKNT